MYLPRTSSVYGVATALGGGVTLFSEPGTGTTIRVYLPATELSTESTPHQPKERPQVAGRVVLIVEDEPQVRQLTKRILERQGYTVLVAETSDDALTLLNEQKPIDLLLTDVVMPGLSGLQLAAEAVAIAPGIRVLYMSGYPQGIWEQGGMDKDLPLLEKPFSAVELLDGVAMVLSADAERS